jgi:glycolate oxidase
VTRDYVLGLEVVLPNGEVLMTGGKTYKGVVGYDLTRLLVGSEGTLGTITKIFLKILPLPGDIVTLLCTFKKLDDAALAVNRINSTPVVPRTLELMDRESVRAVENYKPVGLPLDTEAVLLIEVDGTHAAASEDAGKLASICESFNAGVTVAEDIFSRQRLWEARRSISPALYHIKPTKINEDIVVPRGRVAEMLRSLRETAEKYDLTIANFGHAGDGNIHVNIMTDKNDKEEYQRAKDAVRDIFEAVIRMEGTISGEHGVGTTKKQYLGMELSEASINIMKNIKNIFDPKGIMNPGKIFPDS